MKSPTILKWTVTALLLAVFAQVHAQPLNMGTSPIYLGAGCTNSFIQNNATNTNKIGFGYQWGCTGPYFSSTTIWFNTQSGRIGLGTSNPSYKLHLTSNSAAKPGSSYWTVISDRRFKKDIRSFDDGLELIRGMNPVTFRYKEGMGVDAQEAYVGVIAQELQEVAPYMVKPHIGADGKDYLAVDLHALDFALVNAMQELDVEVQELRAEKEALEARLARLEAMVATPSAEKGPGLDPNGRLHIDAVVPNPSANSTTVHFRIPEGSQEGILEVLDLQGSVLARRKVSKGTQSTRFDLEDYVGGHYVIRLTDDMGHVVTRKLVVAR